MDLLTDLTPAQRQAVTHGLGPCLVIAGAGTGKTRVLTQRIGHLIEQKIAQPEEIVALTFTEKAATEMQERVDELLPLGSNTALISTFHSFTADLLRQYAHFLGVVADFTLLTSEEEIVFLHDHLWELPLKHLRPGNNPNKFLKDIASFFSTLNDQAIADQQLKTWCDERLASEDLELADRAAILSEVAAARAVYDQLLRDNGYLTFGHCITEVLRLFDEHPAVLAELAARYRFLLIDEYQDTNWAQTELASRLAGQAGNIMVVGDDDQAIYSFRGAAVGNLMSFRQRWPNSAVVVLTQNFRSTQSILDLSYRSIQQNNPHRLEFTEKIDKRLVTSKEGMAPDFQYFATRAGELTGIAEQVTAWLDEGIPPNEIAVLCRTGLLARQVEETLHRHEISVASHRHDSLYDRPLIKGIIAFCRLLIRRDDNVAAYELFANPPFKLPGPIWQKICASRDYQEDSLLAAAEAVYQQGPAWLGVSARKLEKTFTLLDTLAGQEGELASDVFLKLVHRSGLYGKYAKSQRPEAEINLAHLGQLFSEIQEYEERHRRADLGSWLRYIDVLIDLDQNVPAAEINQDDPFAVNVLTVHKAKGLEFTAVIVPFCAIGRFPGRQFSQPFRLPAELSRGGETEENPNAEERRLFYVAVTRARERLLCTAAERYAATQRSKISPFIIESFPDVDWTKLSAQVVPPADFLQSSLDLPDQSKPANAPPPLYEQKKLSYSQLSTYLDCPWKYRFSYVMRIRAYPSHAMTFGNVLHAVLQAYLDARRRGDSPTMAELLKKYWRRGGYDTREQEKQRYAEGLRALDALAEKLKDTKPVALEQPFEFPLPNGQRVTGRIDRLDQTSDGKLAIIDYKSGKAKAEREVARDLQLGIYILAVEQLRKTPVASVTLEYLMEPATLTVPREKFALEAVTKTVSETAAKLAADRLSGTFTPTPSSQICQWCEFRTLCPFRYNGSADPNPKT